MGEGAESEGTVIRTGIKLVDSSAKPWTTHSGQMNQKDIAMKKPGQGPRSKATRNPLSTMHQGHAELTIDREIAALIPCLSPEEHVRLERSILAEGCREPLSVWDDGQRRILLDGHNRHSICGRHGLAYEIKLIQLADRDAAIRWVAENQLGRRNLTPEAQSYLRGTLYNNTKRQGSRSDLTSGQSAQKLTTAQQLADRYKVDEKTIRRNARFAERLDALARADRPDIKDQVLTRGARISCADVPRLLELDEETRVRILAEVRGGAKASVLLRDLGRRCGPATPSGASSTGPSSRKTNHVTGERNSALEHLERAAGILRSLSPGSVSSEALEHLDAQVQAITEELERHRQAVAQPADGPRADVLAAAQAVFELESEGILKSPMTILDPLFADPNDPQALQRHLAEVRGLIARRARSSPRSSKRRRLIMPANNILDPRGERRLSFKTFSTIQRYLARQVPKMERIYNEYVDSGSSNPEHARVCEVIDRFMENRGSDIANNSFSYLDYLKMHCTDAGAYREAAKAAGQEITEYLRALNQFATQVLARRGKPTVSPQQRLIRSGVALSMASHPAPTATQPPPMLPQATALTDRAGQGMPVPAPLPARGNRAVQSPASTAMSDAALREKPREHPTPEEVEREVNRIVDDVTSGRLRNSFMGQLEIHRKKWPAHVMNEALTSYRRALNRLSMSTRAASLHQPTTSVPAALAVETVPPTPDAGSVASQTSTPAQPVTSTLNNPSRSSAGSMTEAMALASAGPGTLARAVSLALRLGGGRETTVSS